MNAAILAELQRHYPRALDGMTVVGRSILDRRPFQVEDARGPQAPPMSVVFAERLGYRTLLSVPMLREGLPIGAIALARREARLFTEAEVQLVKTFADQAVIAIENARLFKELQARNLDLTEALARQTATADILGVISSSPTDVQPVFDAIVESAARLCNGVFSSLHTFDGELMHLVAAHNWTPAAFEAARRVWPARPTQATVTGRAVIERTPIHVPDVRELDLEYQNQELLNAIGFRSALAVPMLRNDVPLGVIGVARAEPGPFSDTQIELLQTFADQAVIAIENVRLFKELEARNADLTDALARQTATSQILQTIAHAQTDAQPVFDTIVRS